MAEPRTKDIYGGKASVVSLPAAALVAPPAEEAALDAEDAEIALLNFE